MKTARSARLFDLDNTFNEAFLAWRREVEDGWDGELKITSYKVLGEDEETGPRLLIFYRCSWWKVKEHEGSEETGEAASRTESS